MPARDSAAAMAWPPRAVASNDDSAPARFPMGVRAEETMTEPGMANPRKSVETWMVPSQSVGDTGDEMLAIRDVFGGGASGDALAALPLPESYRGALVLADEQEMFAGVPSAEKDP